MKRTKKIKRAYVYNVWIEIEKIDEQNDEHGIDLESHKIAKFVRYKDAANYVQVLMESD